jgi:hypothetical protein
VPLSSAASEMAKSSFRQKLSRLHRLLGSDNAGERENARTAIDRIARNKKTWNDLTDLLKGESLDPWPAESEDVGQSYRMGLVRRTINLICALGLTGTSVFSFIYFIFYAHNFGSSWNRVGEFRV